MVRAHSGPANPGLGKDQPWPKPFADIHLRLDILWIAMPGSPEPNATHATAAIISVGDELSLGQTMNTNSRWLAQRLTDSGIITVEHTTVPDDEVALAAAIFRLSATVPLILVTGGLGPTADDLTRPALAAAMSDELVEDPLALSQVEAWFAASNREMPEINRVQALRPRRGSTLPNLNGTAPRFAPRSGRCGCVLPARAAARDDPDV